LYLESLKNFYQPKSKFDQQIKQPELLIEYLSNIKGGVGIAFSGGVDSTYLLRIARDACAGQVIPFLLVSPFLSRRERSWAHSIADEIGLPPREVLWYPFDFHCIWENGSDRCYYCKYAMYHELWSICREYGISTLLDGTQLDDLSNNRPGLKAIQELSVKMPLVYCNLNKNNIRILSAKQCLSTWDRPSQSCLATRVVAGTFITHNLIEKIESAEELLTDSLMENTKLRVERDRAYLLVSEEERLDLEGQWTKIQGFLQNIGFHYVYLRPKV
jgi:uncharacterized protein